MAINRQIINKFENTLKKEGVFDLAKLIKKGFTHSEVYLVGGAVRDIVLGRKLKDVDILIRKSKLKDIEKYLKKHGKVNLVGQRFNVLKFKPKKIDREFDIAIPRKDFSMGTGVYKDFKVKGDPDLSIEEDLGRRDFTVNAMAFNLETKELIDPFFGLKDLNKKIIRAVGKPDDRFREDYSRMLRAIRFAMQLDFKIEPKTWSAIKRYMSHINDNISSGKKNMRKVPYEIIASEFLRAFDANATNTVLLYFDCGAMKKLIPEVFKMKGCGQPKEFHAEGDVLVHTLLALKNINSKLFKKYFKEPVSLTTKVAILLHDVAKPVTKKKLNGRIVFYNHNKKGAELAKKIIARLKLTAPPEVGIDGEEVVWLIKNHLLFLHGDPEDMKKTTIEKYLLNERFSGIAHMQLFLADATATRPKGKAPDLNRFKKAMKVMAQMKKSRGAKFIPLLRGDEVMKILKIKSGPKVGEALEMLREEQLSGRIKNKTQAKAFLNKKTPAN